MNVAALVRLEIAYGNFERSFAVVQENLRQLYINNCHEIRLYRIEPGSTGFYCWYLCDDLASAEATSLRLSRVLRLILPNHAILQVSHYFRLYWEFRRLSETVKASDIHLLTFQNEAQALEWLKMSQLHDAADRPNRPGAIGTWTGLNLRDATQVLLQADWASLAVQQEFYRSPEFLEPSKTFQLRGITAQSLSFNLEAIFEETPPA